MAEWLCHHDCDLALIGAIVRFHSCVRLQLQFEGGMVQICTRSRGVLTGSRSSVTLGRVPVEDTISRCLPLWSNAGFKLDAGAMIIGTWVDNFVGFGSDSTGSTQVVDDFDRELRLNWDFRVADDSKI